MFYTKFIPALALLILVSACTSNNSGPTDTKTASATPAPAPEKQTHMQASTEAELAIYQQAVIALSKNQLDEAEKLFTEMSKLQPDFAGSWANLALIDIKKEQYQAAQNHIDTALAKNPNMPQALNIAGKLALRDGQLEQAKGYYQAAIQAKQDYALAHYNLALLYDVYYQDINNAVPHYELYLQYSEQEDEATARWLKGLKSTIKASQS